LREGCSQWLTQYACERNTLSIWCVLIADDHPLYWRLASDRGGALPNVEIHEASDFESLAAALEATPDMDLVLLDLSMPGVRGFSGLLFLRAERLPTGDRGLRQRGPRRDASLPRIRAAAMSPNRSTSSRCARRSRVLDGGQWTPPDLDIHTSANREARPLVRRLSSLTPQQCAC